MRFATRGLSTSSPDFPSSCNKETTRLACTCFLLHTLTQSSSEETHGKANAEEKTKRIVTSIARASQDCGLVRNDLTHLSVKHHARAAHENAFTTRIHANVALYPSVRTDILRTRRLDSVCASLTNSQDKARKLLRYSYQLHNPLCK